jgi:hypothetical protein
MLTTGLYAAATLLTGYIAKESFFKKKSEPKNTVGLWKDFPVVTENKDAEFIRPMSQPKVAPVKG